MNEDSYYPSDPDDLSAAFEAVTSFFKELNQPSPFSSLEEFKESMQKASALFDPLIPPPSLPKPPSEVSFVAKRAWSEPEFKKRYESYCIYNGRTPLTQLYFDRDESDEGCMASFINWIVKMKAEASEICKDIFLDGHICNQDDWTKFLQHRAEERAKMF